MGFGLNQYELVRIPISRRCNGYYLRWYYNGWHYWLWHPGRIGFITEGEKYRTLGTQTLTIGSGQITEEQVRAIRTIKNTREINIYTDSGWAVVRLIPGSVITHNNQIHGYEIEITIIIGSKQIAKDGFSPAISIPVVDPSYEYCETMCIGAQVWMCKNYDSKYPGSKVYDNDEDNRIDYGGLYKHSQVMASGFVPAGWHVPTIAEWITLITECGGVEVAGEVLKEAGTDHWLAVGGLDTYGFSAVGGGKFGYIIFVGTQYHYLKTYGFFWAQDGFVRMDYDSTAIIVGAGVILTYDYYSVRLLRNELCTITPIKYGLLYNWYVTNDVREIANIGWHVPTLTEFQTLATYLGGQSVSGGHLKEIGLTYWDDPNTGADNSSGFNGRGGGYRTYNAGSFIHLRGRLICWTATQLDPTYMYAAFVAANNTITSVMNSTTFKSQGLSIRLIKDSTTLIHGQTSTYTGNDGKVYRTICIGTQEWLADNLCETKYHNGDIIPEVTEDGDWVVLATGALCAYNNYWGNV